MARQYNVVDADGHILEPLNLWTDYIDPAYSDRAPRLVTNNKGRQQLQVDGAIDSSKSRAGVAVRKFRVVKPGALMIDGPAERLAGAVGGNVVRTRGGQHEGASQQRGPDKQLQRDGIASHDRQGRQCLPSIEADTWRRAVTFASR